MGDVGSGAAGRLLSAATLLVRLRPRRPASRAVLLGALLLAVFVALRANDQPGLAVAMYSLIPILLSVSWFGLSGGLVTSTAAVTTFLVDSLLTPTPGSRGYGWRWRRSTGRRCSSEPRCW